MFFSFFLDWLSPPWETNDEQVFNSMNQSTKSRTPHNFNIPQSRSIHERQSPMKPPHQSSPLHLLNARRQLAAASAGRTRNAGGIAAALSRAVIAITSWALDVKARTGAAHVFRIYRSLHSRGTTTYYPITRTRDSLEKSFATLSCYSLRHGAFPILVFASCAQRAEGKRPRTAIPPRTKDRIDSLSAGAEPRGRISYIAIYV